MKNVLLRDIHNATLNKTYGQWVFPPKHFKSLVKIGSGGFGSVYKFTIDGVTFCIKIMIKDKSFDSFVKLYSENNLFELLSGYATDIYEMGNMIMNGEQYDYMIMKYYPNKSLNQVKMTNNDICHLMLFLIKFMSILHTHNLSYSDIKPHNIIQSDDSFIIIDLDTIIPYISSNKYFNTITSYYDISNTDIFTSHPLNQLNSCIYTCLDIMGIYPKCTSKKAIFQYANYLVSYAKDKHIKYANQLEDITLFNYIVQDLYNVTQNLIYTIMSIFYMYILLIPRYTVAYINTEFWLNILNFYEEHIPFDYKIGNELCKKYNVEKNKNEIINSWVMNNNNIQEEWKKIPKIINYKEFTKVIPNVKTKNDLLLLDPRTTKDTKKYIRI